MDVYISESGREALVQLDHGQPVAHLEWWVDTLPRGAYWFCSICRERPSEKGVLQGCRHSHQIGPRLPLAAALRLEATIPTPIKTRLMPGETAPTKNKDKSPAKVSGSSTGKTLGAWAETYEPPREVNVRQEDPEAIKARLAAQRARKNRPSTSPFGANIARVEHVPVP